MKYVKPEFWAGKVLYLACSLLMLVILLFDLNIPLGVAMGVPYIAVVLLSLWSPKARLTYFVAVVSSVLTIGAFIYKPPAAEMWKVVVNRFLALFAIWITAILGLQRKNLEERRELAHREREKALEDVKTLRGLLPICASCKKIRDDGGYWTQIEAYIRDHTEAEFSHGICPDCAKKLYPEYYKKIAPDEDADK